MNTKVRNFIMNFSYTLSSNLISLVISTLVVLVVPKLIGVEKYGYWQLYLFYTSYVGFMHLGWIDGIYLRYGGKDYTELDKKVFFSQFYMLLITQVIVAVVILFLGGIFQAPGDKLFIFQMTAICLILSNMRYMLIFILQGTNRIKEYAFITMVDRVIYAGLIVLFLVFGIRDYKLMIVADLIGKLLSFIYSVYCCKEIVFRNLTGFYLTTSEMIQNISVGIKLMFSNIASTLVIGVVRFGIERSWDVATFGKVSLTLTISNLLMLFINAVGVIMYPILRRTDERRLPGFYMTMRSVLMALMFGFLVFYHPIRAALTVWLPQYKESLMFMALIFPLSVYEGTMALLVNTYLKTLRKEKVMMQINLVTLALSLIMTIITTVVFKNLNLAIFSILVLIIIRFILAENYLKNLMKLNLTIDTLLELALTVVFISTGWFISSWLTMGIYSIMYLLFLWVRRKELMRCVLELKQMMKTN